MYVELPEVGSEVKKGEQFGVIESVKVTRYKPVSPLVFWFWLLREGDLSSAMQAASDVNSPVSGEVTDVNSSLTDESSKVRVLGGTNELTSAVHEHFSPLVLFHFVFAVSGQQRAIQ